MIFADTVVNTTYSRAAEHFARRNLGDGVESPNSLACVGPLLEKGKKFESILHAPISHGGGSRLKKFLETLPFKDTTRQLD
jgi:hypothetical protein